MSIIGAPIDIGFVSTTGRPIQETYLDNAVAWVSEAAALAGIDEGARHQFMPLVIGTTLYWFLADKTTLEPITLSSVQAAIDVAITDAAEIYDAENVENALAEVMGYAMALAAVIAALPIPPISKTITLPAGADLATKIADAVETTNYPTGWVLTAVGDEGKNLQIAHTLTGRRIASVAVKVTDETGTRMLVPFRDAYSGINEVAVMLATPVNVAFTAGAGTLPIATYYYRVSAINAIGETLASTETSLALGVIGGVNVNWGAVAGATGYKVYGRSTGAELLIATVGAVATYLDGGSITPAGALPASNTTVNTTLTIEGLAPNNLPLTIILTFI